METGERRTVAYVLPVYDEVASITQFHDQLVAATEKRPDLDFEFVYVDDGSRDRSLERLLELRTTDPRVTAIGLSRNYGHQIAVTAGLDASTAADTVVIMDTDLQDPPAVSLELIAVWERGADVVYAQRRTRNDTAFKRASAFGFYWLLERLASADIPRNVGDFRLMDRRVVAEVVKFREHSRFLRGIVASVGFRQEAVVFDRDGRQAGRTGYPLRTMIKFAMDGILGFSTIPLRMITRLGLVISFVSLLVAGYAFAVKVFTPENAVPGWAFLGVGMFLLGGIQLVMMGVMGSYLGRVYVEVQKRPLYSVAVVARGTDGDTQTDAVSPT
jgi:dolichol-phosphate mannosyltransferase